MLLTHQSTASPLDNSPRKPRLLIIMERSRGRRGAFAFAALLAFSMLSSVISAVAPSFLMPRQFDGGNDDVTYDNYSLILKGKRVFLQYVQSIRSLCPFGPVMLTSRLSFLVQESSIRSVCQCPTYGPISWKKRVQRVSTPSVYTRIWDFSTLRVG
jgi:hypothetical protein